MSPTSRTPIQHATAGGPELFHAAAPTPHLVRKDQCRSSGVCLWLEAPAMPWDTL
jgi:hypothetical protein